MAENGGIPRFTITLPDEEDLDLLRAIRSTPGVESTHIYPRIEAGTKIGIIGASFEDVLNHVSKKAAIALERIKLKGMMGHKEDSR